jgi:predicted dehydrogenase
LLLHCEWAREAHRALQIGQASDVRLDWRFHSPTVTAGSWKASGDDGGGLLNYYFIHVIALAVFLLGDDLEVQECWRRSTDAGAEIGMRAANAGHRFAASFCIDPAESLCTVSLDGLQIVSAETPFGPTPRRGERDPRINTLKQFYVTSVFSPLEGSNRSQEARIVDLWADMS